MPYAVTIMSAVDELQRTFRKLNETLFEGKLDEVIITIQADSTSGAYGWISVNKVWSDKDGKFFREINLTAEHLQRETAFTVTTLVHEMVHLWNLQNDIKDCSRGGTYHNEKFKEAAEKVGLIVERNDKYGWCRTLPSEDLIQWTMENCREGCFRYARQAQYKNGQPKTTTTGTNGREKTISKSKQSSRKYICPECGETLRATKNMTGKIGCIPCMVEHGTAVIYIEC